VSEGWSRFYAAAGTDPRETLLDALDRFEAEKRAPGTAVDLGCGTGRDTLELLRRGWRVVAIDSQPEAIVSSVRAGGCFCGQLFGVHDAWAPAPRMNFHTRVDVESLLDGLETERLDELEEEGRTAVGETKYWHLFHVVARRP
jgi:SAM-dependent methyltransferase